MLGKSGTYSAYMGLIHTKHTHTHTHNLLPLGAHRLNNPMELMGRKYEHTYLWKSRSMRPINIQNNAHPP